MFYIVKIVDSNDREHFNQFDFEKWSNKQLSAFLETAIEMRVKELLKKMDNRFTASISAINRRLKIPLTCQKELEALNKTEDLNDAKYREQLNQVITDFFGPLETMYE